MNGWRWRCCCQERYFYWAAGYCQFKHEKDYLWWSKYVNVCLSKEEKAKESDLLGFSINCCTNE